jgi:hypothetical protein
MQDLLPHTEFSASLKNLTLQLFGWLVQPQAPEVRFFAIAAMMLSRI